MLKAAGKSRYFNCPRQEISRRSVVRCTSEYATSAKMETPLIAEEGRGFVSGLTGAFSGRRWQGGRAYRRGRSSRDDALTSGDSYQKAAALVDLAEDGVGLPEEILNEERFAKAAKFYFIYIRLDLLWSLNLFAIVVLNFLEKPLWCQKNGSDFCVERKYYFLGQLPYLNEGQSLTYELDTIKSVDTLLEFNHLYQTNGCILFNQVAYNNLVFHEL